VEAHIPDCRSNVEIAPVGGRPTGHTRFPYAARSFEGAPRHPPVTVARTPSSRPFALCRHIAGWTQACN